MKKLFIILILIGFCKPIFAQNPSLIWERQERISSGKLIKTTSDKNLVVCGTYGNDFLFDWVDVTTIMYDTNGNKLWSSIYTDAVNGGKNEPFDMVVDSFDNIYIAGSTHLSADGLPITQEVLLLKYDKFGTLLWKQEFGDSVNFMGFAYKMYLYDNRAIYLAGYGQLISGSQNKSVILKYDSAGTLLWNHIDINAYETMGLDVEVDNSENSYLVGTTACCASNKIFISKYNSSGNMQWNNILYDSAHLYMTAHSSGIDDSANIYIVGSTVDTAFSTGYDCAIAKMDSSGLQKWFTAYTTSNDPNYWDNPHDMVLDSIGNCYVCGTVEAGNSGYCFILKMLSNGSIAWDSAYTATVGGFVSLFLIENSNIVIGGGTGGTSNIGSLVISLDSSGSENFYIQRLGPYPGRDVIQIENSIYLVGVNSNATGPLTDDSLFVFKYADSTLVSSIPQNNIEECIEMFPNPFWYNIFISNCSSAHSRVTVYNLLGELVYDSIIERNEPIDTKGWNSGIYFLKIQSGNDFILKKIIKS